jgi:hypothetical protein
MQLKRLILMMFILFCFFSSIHAENSTSIFNNEEGKYSGSVNGVLFVKTGDTEKTENPLTVLEFQNGKAGLSIDHDENEIYDTHSVNYIGYAADGLSSVKYSTYANANGLLVKIGDITYEISTIDGACEFPVEGIGAAYQVYNDGETVVISFLKEIILNNYWSEWREKKEKGEPYPPYQDAPKKYACIMPDSFLIFSIDNSVSNVPLSKVVVGVLEDDRDGLANGKEGPSQNRVIRPLFEKKGEEWVLSTYHPERMMWTIIYNGKNAGKVESIPESAGENILFTRDLHTPEADPGQKLTFGEPTKAFSGWQNTRQNQPLVVVSEENVSDPENWKAFKPDKTLKEYFRSAFRSEYPMVTNCDSDEIPLEEPWEYGDENINIEKNPIRSMDGDILVSMHLDGCKCGISDDPFLPQIFLFRNDKSFDHLKITSAIPHSINYLPMFLLDAGDYDGDGESEFLFFVSGYNEDGYALFYDSFNKKVLYTWSYH